MNATIQSTIDFDPDIDQALRRMLDEDQEDLAAFDERAMEPTLSQEALLDDLRAHGKL